MREYRSRKRGGQVGVLALQSAPSVVRAPERSLVPERVTENPVPQHVTPNIGFVRKEAGSSFKTALELARPFPLGVLASQVCPYCYNSGHSSPGTRCSYCRSGER